MEVEDIKVQCSKWNIGGDCCDHSVGVSLRVQRNRFIEYLDTLTSLCLTRESQISHKIKGHDFNNGYSCALQDIRGELKTIKAHLKDANVSGENA